MNQVSQVNQIKSEFLFPVIVELLNNSVTAKISVTGGSMYPFLREFIDSVELCKKSFNELKKGDIVLIRRKSGAYVLHRILHKWNDCIYIVGDAQQWVEGPLLPEQIIAGVSKVWRQDKEIKCSNKYWKLLVWFWLRVLPFRYFLLKIYKMVIRLKNFFCGGNEA